MGLQLPSSALAVDQRSKTDMQRLLPNSNPFNKNSVLGAIVTSNANRTYDTYLQLDILQNILMPDTTDGVYAERWAAIYGKQYLPATKSTGFIVTSGTVGGTVNLGTIYAFDGGSTYDVTSTTVLAATSIAIISLTRVGSTVTALTDGAHNLSNVVPVTVSLASEAEYDGVQEIIVTGEDTFTYQIGTTPASPATGAQADYVSGLIPVQSVEFQDSANDVNVNLLSGAELTLQSPIVNVDNDAAAYYSGVSGGTDQETFTGLRTRTLERIQNPVAHFNSSDIIETAKEVPGVTRVFVFEVTPALGQVTIYFMRDNDDDPIPDAGEITTTKDQILTIKPANTSDANVIVAAPTEVSTAFNFTALTPNTPAMQNAIVANLAQFFEEETTVGVDVDEDAYRAAIINTFDPETGVKVSTFTLSTPVADIPVAASGEIATLGAVSFP